jgi:hypothetical protein
LAWLPAVRFWQLQPERLMVIAPRSQSRTFRFVRYAINLCHHRADYVWLFIAARSRV